MKYFMILLGILVGLPLIMLLSQKDPLLHFLWDNEPFHSFIETTGGLIAILMAILLLRRKEEEGGEKYYLLALGFFSMGIIDCFHAVASPGQVFVFLHSTAGLFGGFFFALICLPKTGDYLSARGWIQQTIITFAILFGAWAFIFPETLPAMIQNGDFTTTAVTMNFLAGAFFLLAAVRLFVDFYRSGNIELILLVFLSLLFAISGFTFKLSSLWDSGWWLWHLLRLIAYLLVLVIVVRQYVAMVSNLRVTITERQKAEEELRKHHEHLEETVEERTKELKIMAEKVSSQLIAQQGVSDISETLIGKSSLQEFASGLLRQLMETTESNMGTFYILDEHNLQFEHFTSVGANKELLKPFNAENPEGEFGNAIAKKQIFYLRNIPEDTVFRFKTIAGDAIPKEMITMPILVENMVVALISLVNIHKFRKEGYDTLKQSWTGINTAYSNLLANNKTRTFAEELEGKNQALQAQSEELQSQTQELQQQSEELQEQNVELAAQREQVEEANRLKSEFLSNMSHELRTPLNSVMALSRVLLMQAKDKLSEEELNYLDIIQRNGQNLLSLINDILDLSKIEAGKMDVTPKLFSITSTIETIMERLEPVAEEKGIDMNPETPENLPQIESDEARVHQILQNLMGNALKFTDQGSVTVSARCDEKKVYIQVADTGIGISAKDLLHIFQEFRQVDGTSSRSYEGTGLGLAIAHRAARMLGGELTVQSTLGKGSIFTLVLPVKWSGLIPDAGPFAVTKPAQIAPAQKTVLVVDDEPDVLTMISEYLSLEGYNILTATSGEMALRLAREHRPFAITLDVIMPEMDGWEVLQRLKEDPDTKDIPVIIVSVSDDKETGVALGAVGYVTKPVNRDLLISEIHRIDGSAPHTIMVVDDNEIERKEMAGMIEEEGMKALVAEDGRKCMDMIEESLPDVLVLDLIMPEVDGFEVLDKVRSDPLTRNLPVIVATAKDLSTEEREKLSGNVSSVLTKSDTTSKALLENLKKLLSDIGRRPEHLRAEKVEMGNKILLVEDNEAAVIQVKTILESDGYVVDVVHGGQEALLYVEQNIPDGIILDLMMPRVDGFEVLNKLRSSKTTAIIPVLVLTAKDLTPEDLKKLTANNIQQLVQKGDVDREGLLFRTRLMLGVEPGTRRMNIERRTSNIEWKERRPNMALTRNPSAFQSTINNHKSSIQEPATILVVEDNPDNMTTLKAILKGAYNILEAKDGEEGLNMTLSELPDLVLLDMSLPKMDGFEVAGRIKSERGDRHIPVIALTAHAMKGDREKTIQAGCDDYVSKPVDPEKLLETIENHLRK